VYQQQTAPLIDYYSMKKIMKTVAGVGSIEDIFKKAVAAIEGK
jgi:adenylate kinase family enzyme